MLIILKSLFVGFFFDPNLDDNSAYPDYVYEMLQGDSSGATHTTSIRSIHNTGAANGTVLPGDFPYCIMGKRSTNAEPEVNLTSSTACDWFVSFCEH